jgi:Leucine-rich repeat (LRR) protein
MIHCCTPRILDTACLKYQFIIATKYRSLPWGMRTLPTIPGRKRQHRQAIHKGTQSSHLTTAPNVVILQKLENAKKLGVLSLTEHKLEALPPQMFELTTKLRTLDLSKNALTALSGIERFLELKTLNCDRNQLLSVTGVSALGKLQSLSLAQNQLGRPDASLPSLWPASLKQLCLASNAFSSVPDSILSPRLTQLVKLDLSSNHLAIVPEEIQQLLALEELNLDDNTIVGLSPAMGHLTKLKILSLRNNQLSVTSTLFNTSTNPQPLPAALFTDTALMDLNLHGNKMTNTQLNEFDGFPSFLLRRQKVKSKTMTNLDVCGLQ